MAHFAGLDVSIEETAVCVVDEHSASPVTAGALYRTTRSSLGCARPIRYDRLVYL
jgi:hypothetical protein